MTTEMVKAPRQMPKGGRKGGSVFPRITLSDALAYARKLVSKTHTSAQPQDVILSGVVGAKSGLGATRLSALKQYGFLKGDTKSNYSADELAKKIVAAPPEETLPLYREAILKPTIFKKLFATFHGDVVSKAKLKQRASDLKVHPDETTTCIEIYISGMAEAGLITVEGDQVKHTTSIDIAPTPNVDIEDEDSFAMINDLPENDKSQYSQQSVIDSESKEHKANKIEAAPIQSIPKDDSQIAPRAVFNVSVTLDSSLDIEKLQKQLELLKRFGAI